MVKISLAKTGFKKRKTDERVKIYTFYLDSSLKHKMFQKVFNKISTEVGEVSYRKRFFNITYFNANCSLSYSETLEKTFWMFECVHSDNSSNWVNYHVCKFFDRKTYIPLRIISIPSDRN